MNNHKLFIHIQIIWIWWKIKNLLVKLKEIFMEENREKILTIYVQKYG